MRNLQFSGPFRAFDSLGWSWRAEIEPKESFATDSSIQEVKISWSPLARNGI